METKVLELHPSGFSSFFSCPYAWYRNNLAENPIRTVGSAAHIGSAIHKASEVYYTDCINSSDWVNPVNSAYDDAAVDLFKKRMKEEAPADIKELNENEAINTIRTKKQLYLNNARQLCKTVIPEAVEKTYEVELNSKIPMKIRGTLDIVNTDSIIDIKTMNRRNDPKKYWIQQGVYALMREKQGDSVNDLIIHRVLTTKDEVDSVSILSSGLPEFSIEDLKERVEGLVKTIVKTIELYYKTGDEIVFRGNPTCMTCSPKYCAYWHDCKFRDLK